MIIAEHNPQHPEVEPVVTLIKIDKIPAENIVDTNGAGDAFVGGFLAAMS